MAWRDLFRKKDTVGADPARATPSRPILFGKLPGYRDFVRVGSARHGWFERWLEEGLEAVAAKRGPLPLETTRFLLAPPGEVLTGIFAPSRDAVGRDFPVAILRSWPASAHEEPAAAWHEEAEFFRRAAKLAAEAPTLPPERMEGAVAALGEDGAAVHPVVPDRPDGALTPEGAQPVGLEHDRSISVELEVAAAALGAAIAAAEQRAVSVSVKGDGGSPLPTPTVAALGDDPGAPGASNDPDPAGWTESLRDTPARAALERIFGAFQQGGPAHALMTVTSACDAVSRSEKTGLGLTLELPAPDGALVSFWLALVRRRMNRAGVPIAALSHPERLVLALGSSAQGPALLLAYCLGVLAGPRHWLGVSEDAELRAQSTRNLPAGLCAQLESASPASLLDVLQAFS